MSVAQAMPGDGVSTMWAHEGAPVSDPQTSSWRTLRRGVDPGQPGRPLVSAAALFLATWVAIAIIVAAIHGRSPGELNDLTGMTDLVTGLTAILAILLGTLDVAQWRMVRGAAEPWVGVAMILYGAVFLYAGQVFPVGTARPPVLGYVPPASLVLLAGGLVLAVIGQLRRQLVTSVATWARIVVALAGVTAVLQLSPTLAKALALASNAKASPGGMAAAEFFLGVFWLAVGGACAYAAVARTRRAAHTAVAIVVLGLAQGRFALALAPRASSPQVLGGHILPLVGFAVALGVVGSEFGRQVMSQQSQLLDSVVLASSDRVRREARRALQSAHAHDVRSALFAIDGAAQMMSRTFEQLSDEDRERLSGMLSDGVTRLRTLVDARIEDIEPFDTAALVASVVRAERRLGLEIAVDVAEGVRAVGRVADLAAGLHALFDAMLVDGESGGIALRVSRQGESVEIAVRGPGRLAPTATSVALYVASRLVEEQGGTLASYDRARSLAEYVIRLPAAEPELQHE